LHHYNVNASNKVKYELVGATQSKYILVGYAHVNFIAQPRGAGAAGRDTMVPTYPRSLDSRTTGSAASWTGRGKIMPALMRPATASHALMPSSTPRTGLATEPSTRIGSAALD
ncbi:hypothetical protein BAE44_0004022, partial [Dichanthelium oligosanthes]